MCEIRNKNIYGNLVIPAVYLAIVIKYNFSLAWIRA